MPCLSDERAFGRRSLASGVPICDLNFEGAAVGEMEDGAKVDLTHEFEVSLAMELARAKFVGVGADDDTGMSGDETALQFNGFAEAGFLVVGIFVGKNQSVGGDDVFFGNDYVERAADEARQADAFFDERHDWMQVRRGHSVAGGDGAEEKLHVVGDEGSTAAKQPGKEVDR